MKYLLSGLMAFFFVSCGQSIYYDYDFYDADCGIAKNAPNSPCKVFYCSGDGDICRKGTTHIVYTRESFDQFNRFYVSDSLKSYFETDSIWKTFFPDYFVDIATRDAIINDYYKILVSKDSSIVIYHDMLTRNNIVGIWQWNQ